MNCQNCGPVTEIRCGNCDDVMLEDVKACVIALCEYLTGCPEEGHDCFEAARDAAISIQDRLAAIERAAMAVLEKSKRGDYFFKVGHPEMIALRAALEEKP